MDTVEKAGLFRVIGLYDKTKDYKEVIEQDIFSRAYENYVSKELHDWLCNRLKTKREYKPLAIQRDNLYPGFIAANQQYADFRNRFDVIMKTYDRDKGYLGLGNFFNSIASYLKQGETIHTSFDSLVHNPDKTKLLDALITAKETAEGYSYHDNDLLDAIEFAGFDREALESYMGGQPDIFQ